MTEEVKRGLEFYDKIYQNAVALETQYMKADENARHTEDRSRLETALPVDQSAARFAELAENAKLDQRPYLPRPDWR